MSHTSRNVLPRTIAAWRELQQRFPDPIPPERKLLYYMEAAEVYGQLAKQLELEQSAASENEAREWLIWSNEHRAWWGPERCGYPPLAVQAGRYTLTEARAICRNRHWDDPDMPPETMIHMSEVEHAAGR